MNYALYGASFLDTFAKRYPLPLWLYTVLPRVPEDAPYITSIEFAELPFQLSDGDILEVWELDKRIALQGVKIQIKAPADVVLQPVTNSGIEFLPFDCSEQKEFFLLVKNAILERNTDLEQHSIIIDDPDYFGLEVISGQENMDVLELKLYLICSDTFDWTLPTNGAT